MEDIYRIIRSYKELRDCGSGVSDGQRPERERQEKETWGGEQTAHNPPSRPKSFPNFLSFRFFSADQGWWQLLP